MEYLQIVGVQRNTPRRYLSATGGRRNGATVGYENGEPRGPPFHVSFVSRRLVADRPVEPQAAESFAMVASSTSKLA